MAALRVPLAAAEGPAVCVPTSSGTGDCEFATGLAGGVYVYDRIFVPSGVVVTATSTIELRASLLIHVDGTLLGAAASSPTAAGVSVKLISAGDIVVNGRVESGAGGDAPSTVSSTNNTQGDRGSAGGTVYVQTGTGGVFTLGQSGVIRSGRGGNGGPHAVLLRPEDTQVAHLSARGGTGAQSGALSISALTFAINGRLEMGDGGAGGEGLALANPDTLASRGGTVTARGGLAGSNGPLYLPTGLDALTLYQLGHLAGGVGGAGGGAESYGSAVPSNPGYPANATPTASQAFSSASCGGPGGGYGTAGQAGCDGARVSSYAEDGADGLLAGGPGGPAVANGGVGGTGGDGARGFPGTFDCTWSISYDNCPQFPGGVGGQGGWGGYAYAEGGEGGDGLVFGGPGGDAYSSGGLGGAGGFAGEGGHGRVAGLVYDPIFPEWKILGCTWMNERFYEYVVCGWINDFLPTYGGVCGAGGAGGLSGPGGFSDAVGGRRGYGTLGGTDGRETEERGPFGSSGTAGSPAYWWSGTRNYCEGYRNPY